MLQPPGGATGTHGPGCTLSLSPPGGDGKGQLLTPRSFKLLLQSEGGIKGRSRSPAGSSGEDAASSSTQAALETQTASPGSPLGAGSKFIRGCPAVRASSSSSLRKQDNVPGAARVACPRTPLPLTRCTQLCSVLPGSTAVASSSSAASEGTELQAPGKKINHLISITRPALAASLGRKEAAGNSSAARLSSEGLRARVLEQGQGSQQSKRSPELQRFQILGDFPPADKFCSGTEAYCTFEDTEAREEQR